MLLPSKLVSFGESTLANLAPVLSCVPEEGIQVSDLYLRCNCDVKDTESFIDALTVAFAAGVVRFEESEEMIYHA